MRFAPADLFASLQPAEVAGHVVATSAWDKRHALIPDPVNYTDYRQLGPEAVAGLLLARARQDRFPCDRAARRWPKGFDDDRYRIVTHVDSLDQIGLRVVIAPAMPTVERALGPEVTAHRSNVAGKVWTSRGIGWGGEQRRRLLAEARAERPGRWLAITDVKQHYATTQPTTSITALNSTGVNTHVVDAISMSNESLHGLPGKLTGLPIGPEASGPLGTLSLISVDRRLRTLGVWFARLVDDIWILADTEGQAHEALAHVASQLDRLGQRVNPDKQCVVADADIDEAIQDADIAYAIASGHDLSDAAALELIEAGLTAHDHTKVAFGLGSLRRTQSPAGIPLLADRRKLFRHVPEASGKYLRNVIHLATGDQRELLVARVCEENDDHGVAGRIRLAHALGAVKLDASLGDQLLEAVNHAVDHREQRPLQPHLLVAACRSSTRAWRRAIDIVEDRSSLDLQRGVIATAPRSLAARDRTAIRHLGRRNPECRAFADHRLAEA